MGGGASAGNKKQAPVMSPDIIHGFEQRLVLSVIHKSSMIIVLIEDYPNMTKGFVEAIAHHV